MPIEVQDDGAVRIIRLNRPEKSNAINAEMNLAFGQSMSEAEADEQINVIVLTGAGAKSFCAGMDLSEFVAHADSGATQVQAQSDNLGLGTLTERAFPKPVIAAVNGAAVGGGFGIVLACDIVVAAAHATFAIPEVRRGLVGVGVTSRATLRLPIGVVLQMALTGDALDAQSAKTLGIVSEVAPPGEELARALMIAHQIAEYSPLAVRAVKDIVYTSARLIDGIDMAELRRRAREVQTSKAAVDGARAFVQQADQQR